MDFARARACYEEALEIAREAGDERLAFHALNNLGEVLAAAGCSWRHVVKTTVFLHDMNDFPAVNDIYAGMLGDARPARSTVQVSGLPRGVLVEIDAIASVPQR